MKRFLIISLLAVVSAVCVSGQNKGNALSERGYVGNVGLSISPFLGVGADLFTSHGYSLGNGLWLGGGTGVSCPSAYDVFLPAFVQVKYSFMADSKASPFIGGKVGAMTNFEDTVMILVPEIGADISRLSIFLSADFMAVGTIRYSLGFYWNFK